ncbi:endonuclease V [Streptomyces sp. 6N223]|uniref:endonuclease V n=1 Tax=Streptomyces sp. 6N223 TaxID=3457412 RepID=UPI003FD426C7
MNGPRRRPRRWPATPEEAAAEQRRLRELVQTETAPGAGAPRTIAGVDVAYDDGRGRLAAAVVVLDAGTLAVVERATADGTIAFPYVPGLLAFREIPPVLDALERLASRPDVLVCDGYGIAHPARFGLASHLGVLTGIPCFGVAKTPFLFSHREPEAARGAWTPLTAEDGETVGRALRTRAGVKPVFVSAGHLVGIEDACALTLRLTPRHRLPETTRQADRACRAALRRLASTS